MKFYAMDSKIEPLHHKCKTTLFPTGKTFGIKQAKQIFVIKIITRKQGWKHILMPSIFQDTKSKKWYNDLKTRERLWICS